MKKTLLSIFALILALIFTLGACGAPSVTPKAESDADSKTESPAIESNYSFDHVSIALPEGFEIIEEANITPTAMDKNNPTAGDNVCFTKSGADKIELYSASVLENTYKQILPGFGSTKSFEKTKVSGVDTIIYSYDVTQNGVTMIQTQYLIFGSTYSDVVTFTSITGNYDEAFKTCAASITVK